MTAFLLRVTRRLVAGLPRVARILTIVAPFRALRLRGARRRRAHQAGRDQRQRRSMRRSVSRPSVWRTPRAETDAQATHISVNRGKFPAQPSVIHVTERESLRCRGVAAESTNYRPQAMRGARSDTERAMARTLLSPCRAGSNTCGDTSHRDRSRGSARCCSASRAALSRRTSGVGSTSTSPRTTRPSRRRTADSMDRRLGGQAATGHAGDRRLARPALARARPRHPCRDRRPSRRIRGARQDAPTLDASGRPFHGRGRSEGVALGQAEDAHSLHRVLRRSL